MVQQFLLMAAAITNDLDYRRVAILPAAGELIGRTHDHNVAITDRQQSLGPDGVENEPSKDSRGP